MGQNHYQKDISPYNSQDFFQQQVDFYRWRADSATNTHICRVYFHLQQQLRDKENLQSFIQQHFHSGHYVSLTQILSLANQTTGHPQDQLMGFENYACTLADLEERLSLQEILYCLHCLFSGYEILFGKLGQLKVSSQYCFVTLEGEVRAWMNRDFKINELVLEGELDCPVINSEVTLIKKILEVGERLSSNATQFLHFSRQFRSFMERDVLHNWNFGNARKLINSYVYTYRISLPSNIKEALNKLARSRTNTNITQDNISRLSTPCSTPCSTPYSHNHTKTDLASTGQNFNNYNNNQHSNGSPRIKREGGQRPVSYSDYSSKKSEDMKGNPLKTHSKKFSSTDLKHLNERGKQYESPKMIRSQLIPHKQEDNLQRRQFCFVQNSSVDLPLKARKERELAVIGTEDKAMNTSTQVFSPSENRQSCRSSQNNNSSSIGSNHSSDVRPKDAKENSHPSILKQSECFKQKKKLQKKAAAVSKYITFYQQSRNTSMNDCSVPELSADAVKELSSEQTSNPRLEPEGGADPFKEKASLLNFVFPKLEKPFLQKRQMSNGPDHSPPSYSEQVSRKPSFEMSSGNVSYILPFRGKTEHFRQLTKIESGREGSQPSSINRDCFTLKTLDKLIDNNEVSELESNGSFMSIPQSNGSEYHGALSKMGRSVDIMNLPSNKHVPVTRKAVATSNHLGKTYNS